jgi:rhomboid protease GluP
MLDNNNFKFHTTLKLVVINLVFFLLATFVLFSEGSISNLTSIELLGAFNSYAVDKGAIWLFVTSNFLQISFLHFLLNITVLYQLGRVIETFYSSKKLLVAYVVGGIVSGLFTYLFFDDSTVSLGASGSIYALFGILFGATFKNQRYGQGLPIDRNQLMPTVFLGIILSFLPFINWAAHLGGFIAGGVMGYFFNTSIGRSSARIDSRQIEITWIISILIIVLSYLFLLLNLVFKLIEL